MASEATRMSVPPGYDRRSSGEHVTRYIRSLIWSGELTTGDRLRQDDIAATLNVSRIPVREAMIALDREGWVRIEPHRGAYVTGLDADSVRDHYELLGMLYGLAGRRASERASDEDLRKLTPAAAAIEAATTPEEVLAASEAMLRLVFTLAESPRLRAISRAMTGIVPGNFFAEVEGATRNQQAGIAAVVRAIRKRDGDRVAKEWLTLLRRQGDAVVAVLDSRHVIAER